MSQQVADFLLCLLRGKGDLRFLCNEREESQAAEKACVDCLPKNPLRGSWRSGGHGNEKQIVQQQQVRGGKENVCF